MKYLTEIEELGKHKDIVLQEFFDKIGAKAKDNDSFVLSDKTWYIDEHPFDHSDDIIIEKDISEKYDNFLLIKTGGNRVRIAGWCSKEQLIENEAKDIYRNGKKHHIVHDTNVKSLEVFKLLDDKVKLKESFIINKQKAESLAGKEYIDSVIAGLHSFAKTAGVYFKDINQKDEFILGDKKVKIYLRDSSSDEDILIRDKYFLGHPEIEIYMVCKEKGGAFWYVGYVTKETVENTRIVQMIGQDSDKASDSIRRIFAEQLSPISDLIEIYEEITEEEIIEEQKWCPLHLHSEFSVGDAYGNPQLIAEKLRKKGFKGAALTDHGTLAGTWSFQKAMLSEGLKPVLGCEIYIKIPELQKRNHLTVWVKNAKGWENLMHLQHLATSKHFYYNPIVQIEDLFEFSEGLMIGSGCIGSPVHKLISDGEVEIAEKYVKKFKEVFGDDYYGEIQPTIVIKNQEVMKISKELHDKHGIKLVFTNDAHYPDKNDKEVHEAVKAIAFKKDYGTAGYGDDCFYYMTDEDIVDRLTKIKENNWLLPFIDGMKANTFEVVDKVDFAITPPKEMDTLPKMAETLDERKLLLKHLIHIGLSENTPYKYEDVKERLDLEVDRMLSKDYENYFLLVHDIIKWAKDNGIMVGPGRGSVGASLAAYALGITTCDPLRFDLLFDRFLSEIRRDMPDVDMDFQDNRRHEIYTYLIDRFGEDHCAKVATYSRFHAKGLLRDLGRIFNIPIGEIEKIAGLVIERSGGDARASFTLLDTFSEFEDAIKFKEKYPQVVDLAVRLEGSIRHKGMHAAAMVVTEKPIHHYAPVTKVSGEYVIEWEKQLAEDMKLNKLDILGLTTLTVISECINDIKASGKEIILPDDFNDAKVYDKIFKTGDTLGVFQFETVGLSKLSKTLKIDDFKLLHDATTLFRPGALHSGQTMQYVNRRAGTEEIKVEHPLLEEITKETKGIILYQEQIMQIMNRIGGMSWATAEMARKVITKSKGKKAFEEMRAEFVANAGRLHGMSEAEAMKLYDVVSTFGSYSFNKAHAVEYSIISYWCAWLKTHYPVEFYKSSLKHASDDSKILSVLQQASRENIEIVYPDINKSGIDYKIIGRTIYAGFSSIKGIGKVSANKIIRNQPYASYEDFIKRCKPSQKILKGLIIADCFRSFNINQKEKYYDIVGVKDFNKQDLIGLIMEHTNLKPKYDMLENMDFPDLPYKQIGELSETDGDSTAVLRGVVTVVINKDKLLRADIKKHNFKFEYHMIYLNLNDGTGNIAIQINPWTYTSYKTLMQSVDKKSLVIHGKLARDGQKMYGELLQQGREGDVTDYYRRLKTNNTMISSSTPAVSKKGKSYYRVELSNGVKGLCFRFTQHLLPGLFVGYSVDQDPFIDITVLKNKEQEEEHEKNN